MNSFCKIGFDVFQVLFRHKHNKAEVIEQELKQFDTKSLYALIAYINQRQDSGSEKSNELKALVNTEIHRQKVNLKRFRDKQAKAIKNRNELKRLDKIVEETRIAEENRQKKTD